MSAASDKAHLQVELGELGLAVGAQVFVAEAAGDLEVALDAGHHEQLLQLLRALRQGVELAGMQPTGHDEIARAFGRALEQDRRLDLQESPASERNSRMKRTTLWRRIRLSAMRGRRRSR